MYHSHKKTKLTSSDRIEKSLCVEKRLQKGVKNNPNHNAHKNTNNIHTFYRKKSI